MAEKKFYLHSQAELGVGAMLSLTNVLKPLATLPQAICTLAERIGEKQ